MAVVARRKPTWVIRFYTVYRTRTPVNLLLLFHSLMRCNTVPKYISKIFSRHYVLSYSFVLLDLASDLLLSLALSLGIVYRQSWDVLLRTLTLGVVWRRNCSLELMAFLSTFSSGVSRRGLEGAVRPFGRRLGWRRRNASQLVYSRHVFNP